MKLSIATSSDMENLGATLAQAISAHCVIFLSGDLGAGKTTLVRGFLRGLGYVGSVKSPTYTLVELYQLPSKNIAHFDLYRLIDPEELELIGLRETIAQTDVCLIEWPENGTNHLPTPDIHCTIVLSPDFSSREVLLRAMSQNGKDVLQTI